jgi:hypothetical protein
MSGISFDTTGSFNNTERFLQSMQKLEIKSIIEPYAQRGVAALAAATPVESGLASESWGYEIVSDSETTAIYWTNTDIEDGFPVAVALQYGHATGTGGYVQGRDYINPAIRPIFDQIAEAVWKVVTSS